MRKIVLALAVLSTAACASFRPGSGVSEDFASAYYCSAKNIKARADSLKQQLKADEQFIPRVGWNACDLLAHNGVPTRIDRTETGDIVAQSWWYQAVSDYSSETHLVTLQLAPRGWSGTGSPWIVTYVGW